MIQKDGLDQVSLRNLAKALGVTAPALYAYVEGKGDLLQAVAEGEFESLIALFEADQAATDDTVERIRRASHTYVSYARDNPELFKVMFLFPPALFLGCSLRGEPKSRLVSALGTRGRPGISSRARRARIVGIG